jgi:hypothetical protein
VPGFLEPVAFVFRAGPEATEYGKPYTFSATVVAISHDVAEIRGATRQDADPQGAVEIYREMQRCLRDAGFKQARWERRRSDGSAWVTVNL